MAASAIPQAIRARSRTSRRWVTTCIRAAKYLPTVRRAVPAYVWPILAVATAIKVMPVIDFEIDEVLYVVAALLIAWRRPGLLKALYRETQAGKPARCQCGNH